jgi:hypothetical protein
MLTLRSFAAVVIGQAVVREQPLHAGKYTRATRHSRGAKKSAQPLGKIPRDERVAAAAEVIEAGFA